MATGVVSIGLSLDGRETLSRILAAAAATAWVVLGFLLVAGALVDRDRVHREPRSPAALTGVAGTGVLGNRLTLLGWNWAGGAQLAITLASWLVLLRPVCANWATPTVGVSCVLAVSTEALAVLSATPAEHARAPWLLHAALARGCYPRPGYDVRRWQTVFPVATYAACSFAAGRAADVTAITDFARIWVWVGAALWLVVAVAMLRGGVRLLRGLHPPITAERIDAIAPSRRSATRPAEARPV